MENVPQKVCVICGLSCVGQPRVRNEKGQYAHQACARISAASSPEAPEDADDSEDEGLLGSMLDDLPAAPPAGSGNLRQGCPGCGVALGAGVVVCTSCGFNLQTGKGLKTKVGKAPSTRERRSILETSALAAGTTHLLGACLGAGLGAVIGAAVWAGVISAVQFQASFIAIGVAALCGIGAAYGSRGNVGFMTGAIATVCAVAAILAGKWYGGSALADAWMDEAVGEFIAEWDDLDREGRIMYAQRDRAEDLIIERLEAGEPTGIDSDLDDWLLGAEEYPENYPLEIVSEVDDWWSAMDQQAQANYVADLPDRLIAQYRSQRQEIREIGFLATIGFRDAIYFVLAVVVAFGLGANENTAPFLD